MKLYYAGQIADRDVSSIDHCTQGIMHVLLCTKTASIITECVNVLTILLLHNPDSAVTHTTIKQLAKLLIIENGIETPAARSSVVYLIAHFHSVLSKVAPDILRILSIGFAHEDVPTKCQIMNFAIKLSLLLPEHESVQTICMYILEMSRYDVDTDLRDRSRFMTALLGLVPSSDNHDEEGQSNINSNGVSNEDALAELNEHAHGTFQMCNNGVFLLFSVFSFFLWARIRIYQPYIFANFVIIYIFLNYNLYRHYAWPAAASCYRRRRGPCGGSAAVYTRCVCNYVLLLSYLHYFYY